MSELERKVVDSGLSLITYKHIPPFAVLLTDATPFISIPESLFEAECNQAFDCSLFSASTAVPLLTL